MNARYKDREAKLLDHSFWFYGIAFFGIILGRYFLVAGGTYLCFYLPLRQSSDEQKLQQNPSWQSIKRDIELSILSAAVFAIASAFIAPFLTNPKLSASAPKHASRGAQRRCATALANRAPST